MKNSGTSGGGTMPELDLLKAFQHCTSLKTLAAKQDGKPTVRRLEKRFRLERLRAMLQELIRFIVPRKRVAKSAAPIVGHDGLWKDDVRLMELVVQSIFRTSSLNGNLVKILQHLNTNRAALETHEQLCEEVKTCLNLLKSRRTLSPAEEKRYFQALAEHRQTTLGNIRAYQGETKFNWRAIWYPDGSVPPPHGRSIYADEQLPYAQINRLVTRATPIGSAGSCFAAEIRSILIKEGFNYVTTEPNDLTCAEHETVGREGIRSGSYTAPGRH
jgi:hypothetical protein